MILPAQLIRSSDRCSARAPLPPDLYEPDRWTPHISLVSHELRIRADLREEVEDYVNGLGAIRGVVHRRYGDALSLRSQHVGGQLVARHALGPRTQLALMARP